MRSALRELIYELLVAGIGASARVWLETRPQRTSTPYVVFAVQVRSGSEGSAPLAEVDVEVTTVADSAAEAAAVNELALAALQDQLAASAAVSLFGLTSTSSDSDYSDVDKAWWTTLRLQGLAAG